MTMSAFMGMQKYNFAFEEQLVRIVEMVSINKDTAIIKWL
jgi:hypothetical protein